MVHHLSQLEDGRDAAVVTTTAQAMVCIIARLCQITHATTTATYALWIPRVRRFVTIRYVIVAVMTLQTVVHKDYGMNLVINFFELEGLMKIRVELLLV